MKSAELIDYCLTFKGSYLDFPFGEQCACIRVGKTHNRKGRIFAQVFKLNETYMVTFNCDVMTGNFYKQLFPDIILPAYHCPEALRQYAYTLPVDGVSQEVMKEMAASSYVYALKKLPKYISRNITEE